MVHPRKSRGKTPSPTLEVESQMSQQNFDEPFLISGDSWMYLYQRTPMGNPFVSPFFGGYKLAKIIPKNPIREHQLNTTTVHKVQGIVPRPCPFLKL